MNELPEEQFTAADIAPSPGDDQAVSRVLRMGALLDRYGALLTERQRQFMEMHYEEDLSFSEIAEHFNVSRQAIHDAVKHACEALESYEAKLGLVAGGVASGPNALAGNAALTPIRDRLKELHERLRRSGGILYDTGAITREVGEITGELDRLLAPPPPADAAAGA